MASDKIEQLKRKFADNADRFFIGGIVVMFVGVAGLRYVESQAGALSAPAIPPYQMAWHVKENDANFELVSQISNRGPRLSDPEHNYRTLLEENPFDPKEVRNREELEQKARTKIAEAKRFRSAGELDKALSVINEALDILRGYKPAKALREDIEADIAEADGGGGE